jgi:hypothetical protein
VAPPAPVAIPEPPAAIQEELAAMEASAVEATEPAVEAAPSTVLDLVIDESRLADADPTNDDMAPSRQDILARAAARPPRMTWESIVLNPSDPILGAKMQPRVAERRARFRRIVKVALGACVAMCLVGTAATALSSNDDGRSAASSSRSAKTAPASGVVPVEKLEIVMRGKASSHVTATTRLPAPKWGKHR